MAEFRITDFLKKQPQPVVTTKKKEPAVIADSYGKEPVVIIDKTADGGIAIGDKIKILPAYAGRYCNMQSYIGKVAEVVKISSREAEIDGVKHNIICLWIKYPNETHIYMVSPTGYEKA
jgi:hypothetical protein